jgi:hypothetical protein
VRVTDENRAMVLASLYNYSQPLGMGFRHYTPGNMTLEEAQVILDDRPDYGYFDYLRGRVMKVDLGKKGSEVYVDFYLYDRDNGEGCGRLACRGLEV